MANIIRRLAGGANLIGLIRDKNRELAAKTAARLSESTSGYRVGKVGTRIPSYKRGGVVKRTGLAYVHKGERVTKK